MKTVSSRYVIHKNSAISYSSKINILTNELLRVMRNISPYVSEEEKQMHIQYFMYRLQFSGYNKEERINVYRRSTRKFQDRQSNASSGLIPLYRSKFWNVGTRKKEKEQKRKHWYTKGGYKATFFIDATPKENIARKCQALFKECDLPIKVLEKSGRSIKQHLVRSDPFKETKCSDENCPICILDNGINCKMRDTVYHHECDDFENCNGAYVGETSDSIKERTQEHKQKCRQKLKESAHYKHNLTKHNGEEQNVKVTIRGKCPNDPMLRQCMEAILIKDINPEMNLREEWGK